MEIYPATQTLADLIADLPWPTEFFTAEDLPGFLDQIYVINHSFKTSSDAAFIDVTLGFEGELALQIPGVEGCSFVMAGEAVGATILNFALELSTTPSLSIYNLPLALRFDNSILKGADFETGEANGQPSEISVVGSITIDHNFDLTINGFDSFNLSPSMIADSGVIVSASDVKFDFSRTSTIQEITDAGYDEGFMGVYMGEMKIQLPESMQGILPEDIVITDAIIGNGGVSGELLLDYSPTWDDTTKTFSGDGAGEIFGMAFGMDEIDLAIKQNCFERFGIKGQIYLSYFDKLLNVTLGVDSGGDLIVDIDAEDGLVTLETEVFDFTLDSLGFSTEDGVFTAKMSGSLTPKFGAPTLTWPSFDIEELSIDSEGNVKLEGGWLNFPDQYTLDFYGFQIEIAQIGFGQTDDGGKWVGFSGGLNLVEGLSAGASVDGLRIAWYDDGRDPKISLDGVGVELEIPEVLSFKGSVAFREFEDPDSGETIRRFDGEIKLQLISLNLTIDATLVIGSVGSGADKYNFFGIYLGIDLPAGIPLWSTGLALYGMEGLFATNLVPDKADDEAWYGIGEGEGWYKRPDIGVTDIADKWTNQKGGLGLGAGVTIGTLPDNGFTFNGRLLFALVFPGPIIMLEGKANLLKDRASLSEDPLFRTLVVIDGSEGTFLAGLDAQYKYGEKGNLIDIGGGAEAFFSFSDPLSWHLYLGMKEPTENRIRAEVFKLFEANAYFMLDAYKAQMGAWIGWDESWKFGPVKLTLEAWLEGNAVISWYPAYFYGDVWAHGKFELSVAGFSMGLSLDAKLATQVFDPFSIYAELAISVNLPWPIPDFEVNIEVQWGPDPVAPDIPLPLQEGAVEHLKVSSSWTGVLTDSSSVDSEGIPSSYSEEDLPVVPLDARPHITFRKSVHDVNMIGVNVNDPSPAYEWIGDPEAGEGPVQVKYMLDDVVVQKFEGTSYVDVASKALGGDKDIYGSWAPMPAMPSGEPEEGSDPPVDNTKLWLWSKSPFEYTRQISRTWEEWFADRYDNYPCPPEPGEEEFCFDFEDFSLYNPLQNSFSHPDEPDLTFSWNEPEELSLTAHNPPVMGFQNAICLDQYYYPSGVMTKNTLTITFPEAVSKVRLIVVAGVEGVIVRSYTGTVLAGPYLVGVGTESDPLVEIEMAGNQITYITIEGMSNFCLFGVCYCIGATEEETDRYQDLLTHVQDEMARWEDVGEVFEPYSKYRIKIETSYETKGDFTLSGSQTNYLYFRTEGPPGLVTLSSANNPVEEGSDTALEDLTLYVEQTVPATVAAEGEAPLLPKPVYRAYDVGVEFIEDYVDLMYRIAGRDLAIYLYDNNNQPVRDAEGRLVVLANQWGVTEESQLSESTTQYLAMLNDADCTTVDESSIPHDSALTSVADGVALDADSLYEARLQPLLFKDDFQEDTGRWSVVTEGTTDGPADWQIAFHDAINGSSLSQSGNTVTLGGSPDLSEITEGLDSIIIEEDTQRPAKSYRILSVDDGTDQLVLDGEPMMNGSTSAWTIPALGGLLQTSNVHGGSTDANDPEKPGTMYILDDWEGLDGSDAQQPSQWSDMRFTTIFRMPDDDAIGVVFRYVDDGGNLSYYRFSMDRERTYRRLVKVENGAHTILAEDSFVLETDADYELGVEAIGSDIRIYLNGDLIFEVEDDALATGTIGLYVWANTNARFGEVRVDDYRSEEAAVAYAFEFTTSNYSHFFHHLHSYLDEVWPQEVPGGMTLADYKADAVSASTSPSDDEYRLMDAFEEELLGSDANLASGEVQISRLDETDLAKAFHLRSSEPILWDRVEMELLHTSVELGLQGTPDWLKLTDMTFSDGAPIDESVTLLLNSAQDVNGLEITHSTFRSIGFDSADNVLFEADFSEPKGQLFKETFGPNALDSYTIVDTGTMSGPSNWSVIGSEIVDTSNISGGSVTEAEGTVAVTGDGTWENIRLRATVRSTDDDSVGVVFRYQDESNYVRYSIDQQRSYRRIMEVVDGVYTTIWEDDTAYVSGTDYEIDIRVYDTTIVVFHGEVFVAAAELSQSTAGQAGFYAWMNNGSYFSAFQVDSLHSDPLLWRANFPSDEIRYKDASGYTVGPSDWKIENDFLVNRANVSASSIPDCFGTFSYLGNESFGDARITARVRSEDDDSIGIMFRMQTDDETAENPDWNYYRFSIDKQRTFHRLVKVIDGTVTTLWEDTSGTYNLSQTYEMGISCIDDEIKLYLDGVLLATVNDSEMLDGQIAAYCYYHDHAVFEEVVVTDNVHRVGPYEIVSKGTSYGPSDWTTDQGVFRERSNMGGGGPLYAGTMAILEEETYDDFTMKAEVRSDDDDGVGIIFRYQDPRNYYRFALDLSRSYKRLVKVVDGVANTLDELLEPGYEKGVTYELKVAAYGETIRAFIDGEEIFKVSDSEFSEGRIGLYANINDATEFSSLTVAKPSTDAYLLFSDEFSEVALPDWTVVDQGSGSSQWEADGGRLVQTMDIGDPVTLRTNPEKLGTLISAGDPTWTDYVFTALVQSADNDEIGLLFRYTDENNHYRFTMDREGGFRRLIDVSAGAHTVLWEDDFAYEQDTAYDLKVVLEGGTIEVYTNGLLTLHLDDSSHSTGQIGFHTWENDDAAFSQVRVYDLALIQDEADFDEDFSNPFEGVYQVVDDGTGSSNSNWTNSGSYILQSSNYYGSAFSGSDPDKEGTYAATYASFEGDHRVEVALSTTDNDGLGLMFRYQDNDSYYRLSMDMQKGYRRLIRKDPSGVTVLWEDLTAGFNKDWGQTLAVDCVGDVITGYLNGVELFQVEDATYSEGRIALYTWGCTNVRFHRVRVLPAFQATWYRFADEPMHADGTVFRIFSGPASELPAELPTIEARHVAEPGEAGRVHFLGNQLSLDVLDADGESVHAREFLRKSQFSNVGFEVLRKRDGTGAVLFPTASDFAEGTYLLRLTFRRDNTAVDSESQVLSQWGDRSDEVVELVLPWELLETE